MSLRLVKREQRVVVVLGMHRSGTSVITRALQALGVSLGDRLMPPAEENPKGFFEDLDINATNIALLQALGHDWHSLSPILSPELTAGVVSEFKLRALSILRERLALTDCFGFKDPRLARLLVFWQDVFAKLQIAADYVIVCRNPLSVARSLTKRNGFDVEKGYYLWFEHVLESLVRTENQNCIVVDYDLFLEDPAKQLRRIARALGLEFDPRSPMVAEFIAGFVEDSLRHNQYRFEDLPLDQALPPCVADLYKTVLELASDNLAFDSPTFKSLLERFAAQAREFYPALLYMRRCEDKAASAARQLALIPERDRQIAVLNKAVAEQQADISRLNSEISSLAAQLSAIHGSRAWKILCLLRSVVLPFRSRSSPTSKTATR